MKEASHKIFIERYLNWALVRERLDRYENISKFYPLDDLQRCSNKSPYYCHYLSWRLGTWAGEEWFGFFDSLLAHAIKIPNWKKDRIPQGCEFENFWSFLWELQVTQLFANQTNTTLNWNSSGPDLTIHSPVGEFFVECTTYRKSYGLEEFINELLGHIHPWIKATHRPFNIFSLPKNENVEPFLDELFSPFLEKNFLQQKIRETEEISPVILPMLKEVKNFYVYVESDHPKNFRPDLPWTTTGPLEDYLVDLVKKVLDNKRDSNELKFHRPNLLAVNLSLGQDYQLARSLRNVFLPTPHLGIDFDAVFLTACGIDKLPSLRDDQTYFCDDHPVGYLLRQ